MSKRYFKPWRGINVLEYVYDCPKHGKRTAYSMITYCPHCGKRVKLITQ